MICANMVSVQNTVHYCCVWRGGRVVHAYNSGNPDIENLALLCLERTPPYHRWYLQTMDKRTFGFLMEDGYVYFVIADEGLGNKGVLGFLQHLRDEFREVTKKGSSKNMANVSSLCLQDQLVPVIHGLIYSLENVSRTSASEWPEETPPYCGAELSPSAINIGNGRVEGVSSTKAPLLGKPSKQEKKKMKEHVIGIRDIELEENRKSTERGARVDLGALDSNSQNTSSVSPKSLRKDFGSARFRSSSPHIRRKWCRLVRIVLAIDLAVCLVLFGVWLGICGGLKCIT